MGNDMCRFVCDVETLCGHDCGISGGSMLCVESALLSMSELRDTEETDPYQQVVQRARCHIMPVRPNVDQIVNFGRVCSF